MRTLLAPLRLAIGWGFSPRLVSVLAATMLVLLRLTVGWHFYAEGVEKTRAGDWTATPFFANATGPLRGRFRGMVWDYDGQIRLDRDRTLRSFAAYRDRVSQHFEFDEEQKARAQDTLIAAMQQHQWILDENAGDLEEYEFGRERLKSLDWDTQQSRRRDGVQSLGGQRETIRREWEGKAAPTLTLINKLWSGYEQSLNAIANREQADRHGYLPLGRPSDAWIDTSTIDRLIPTFDIVVGLLLMLGLFTPVAALAAAGFLGSVFLSQYPPGTGPTSSMYQLIECMACCVLAAMGAGRFAGLDYFLHLFVRRQLVVPDREFEDKYI